MKNKIAAILVTLFFIGGPVSADEIILNNGDHLTGNVVELGEDILRMATASGEIIVPRNRVVSAFLGTENPSESHMGAKAGEKYFENLILSLDTIADGVLEE